MEYLHRQLGVPATDTGPVDRGADIRADDGDVTRKSGNRAEEVAKEDHDAVELDAEADQGPP